MTRRITTWNIKHGGGGTKGRQVPVAEQLLKFDADILVVTEFRPNASGAYITDQLQQAGYSLTHPGGPEKANSVLIGSRSPITYAAPFDVDLEDHRHIWSATTSGIRVCGIYMPMEKAKIPYWQSLFRDRESDTAHDLYIGDFNTGNNEIDLTDGATKYTCADLFDDFHAGNTKELWRTFNPVAREYSWYSNHGNGFRLDHAFAKTSLQERVVTCRYEHEPRENRLSDHSALTIELSE
ncbi:endonuclease/exonuclease/phosphatase family protein [Roseibium sp.]|uniref:endonuclease/exonuclease/phosphatase family protein n=1 Tax=Roseibium sp. TaxID=1936156 RepID=UPI003A973FA3